MTDPIALLAPVAPASPVAPSSPVAARAGPGTAPGTFGQTLGAFLDAQGAAADGAAPLPPTLGRQGLADDGKDAPGESGDGPGSDEAADDATATATATSVIWFPTALPPLPALPTPAPADDATSALDPAAAAAAPTTASLDTGTPPAELEDAAPIAAMIDASPPPVSTMQNVPTVPAARLATAPGPAALPLTQRTPQTPPPTVANPAPAAIPPTDAAQVATAASVAAPIFAPLPATRADAPLAATPADSATAPAAPAAPAVPAGQAGQAGPPASATAPPIAVSTTPQPAGQLFAAAIAAAASWRDRDARGAKQEPADATAPPGIAASLQAAERAVVHATGDTGGTALDLTQDTGLHRMIDHIETLRDAVSDHADAQDTRIRLVPDALGHVDVAVRQDGGGLHVSFTAEHAATATLIADAQPRLAELAAERGVTIGGSSVATDSGAQRQQARPAAVVAAAPASATTESEIEPHSDARVA